MIVVTYYFAPASVTVMASVKGFFKNHVFCDQLNLIYEPDLTEIKELTELSNKLFMYCDAKQWNKMWTKFSRLSSA
jgi:hypothetical protein